MVRKMRKHSIEGINQKRKGQVLTILRVFNLHQNCKNFDIYTEIHLRLLIENIYKSNELRAELNPGILSHPI